MKTEKDILLPLRDELFNNKIRLGIDIETAKALALVHPEAEEPIKDWGIAYTKISKALEIVEKRLK